MVADSGKVLTDPKQEVAVRLLIENIFSVRWRLFTLQLLKQIYANNLKTVRDRRKMSTDHQ
jgi:hypothetical protein